MATTGKNLIAFALVVCSLQSQNDLDNRFLWPLVPFEGDHDPISRDEREGRQHQIGDMLDRLAKGEPYLECQQTGLFKGFQPVGLGYVPSAQAPIADAMRDAQSCLKAGGCSTTCAVNAFTLAQDTPQGLPHTISKLGRYSQFNFARDFRRTLRAPVDCCAKPI